MATEICIPHAGYVVQPQYPNDLLLFSSFFFNYDGELMLFYSANCSNPNDQLVYVKNCTNVKVWDNSVGLQFNSISF